MKLKSILLSTFIAGTPLLAIAKPLVPNRCPSVEAIKTVPMDKAVGDWVFGALAYNTKPNKYDTNDEWTMVMVAGKDIDTEEQALKVANEDLTLLATVKGPEQDGDQTICFYSSDDLPGRESQAGGWAINPAHEGLSARLAHLKR